MTVSDPARDAASQNAAKGANPQGGDAAEVVAALRATANRPFGEALAMPKSVYTSPGPAAGGATSPRRITVSAGPAVSYQ